MRCCICIEVLDELDKEKKKTTSYNFWKLLTVSRCFCETRQRDNERTSRAKAREEAAAVILEDKDCFKQWEEKITFYAKPYDFSSLQLSFSRDRFFHRWACIFQLSSVYTRNNISIIVTTTACNNNQFNCVQISGGWWVHKLGRTEGLRHFFDVT